MPLAGAADETVVATKAEDRIVATKPVDSVGQFGADQGIVIFGSR